MSDLNVIVGLGKTGLSCVRYCLREGLPFAVVDSREHPPYEAELSKLAPHCLKAFGGFKEELILKASRLIVSPGVSLHEPALCLAKSQGIPFTSDMALFLSHLSKPVIAVTGSNAKSTVVTLVYEMAKEAGKKVVLAGNIGTPVLDVLPEPLSDLYVLELSSFQLDLIPTLNADVAVLLNISEDHMDRYESFKDYVYSKFQIYDGVKNAVFARAMLKARSENECLLHYETWEKKVQPKAYATFGLDEPQVENDYGLIEQNGATFLAKGRQLLIDSDEIKLKGRHNLENALCALALCDMAGIPLGGALHALKHFTGLPHRCQWVGRLAGVEFYNDSKGTNVGATLAAIHGLGIHDVKNLILIAGGLSKGADFSPLKEPMSRFVKHLILLGEDAVKIERTLRDVVDIRFVTSMDQAVLEAFRVAKHGDHILLSPACASMDMFKNYEHRGDAFIAAVKRLQSSVFE